MLRRRAGALRLIFAQNYVVRSISRPPYIVRHVKVYGLIAGVANHLEVIEVTLRTV